MTTEADQPADADPPQERWSFIASTALVIALAYSIEEKAPEVGRRLNISAASRAVPC
jgi:hypothetical protein